MILNSWIQEKFGGSATIVVQFEHNNGRIFREEYVVTETEMRHPCVYLHVARAFLTCWNRIIAAMEAHDVA